MSLLTGLAALETLSYPSALALGHIMAALTGLAARTPIRYRIFEIQYYADEAAAGDNRLFIERGWFVQ